MKPSVKKFSFHIHSSIYFLIFLWQKVSTTHNRALLYYILFFHFGQDFLLSSSLLPSASNAFFGVFFKKHIVDKRWPPIFMIFWKVCYHCWFITKSTYNKRQQHFLVLEWTPKYWTSNTMNIECLNIELSEHHILAQYQTLNMSNITKNRTVREHQTVCSKTTSLVT